MNSLSAMLATSGIEHLGLFIAAGILLNLTPGPVSYTHLDVYKRQ